MEGWIKLHRKLFDNQVICKDAETISIWVYLLLSATHKDIQRAFAGEKITLKPGQLITGRKKISDKLAVTESKVQRTLKRFEDEQQIEQRMSNGNRLITIVSWDLYQGTEQQVEQPVNNERTASEQPVNTNKNERIKELKKKDIKSIAFASPTVENVIGYCNENGYKIDAERFIDFYSSKGWMVGKNKMKDWKAAVRNWCRSEKEPKAKPATDNKFNNFDQRQYDYETLEKQLLNS